MLIPGGLNWKSGARLVCSVRRQPSLCRVVSQESVHIYIYIHIYIYAVRQFFTVFLIFFVLNPFKVLPMLC